MFSYTLIFYFLSMDILNENNVRIENTPHNCPTRKKWLCTAVFSYVRWGISWGICGAFLPRSDRDLPPNRPHFSSFGGRARAEAETSIHRARRMHFSTSFLPVGFPFSIPNSSVLGCVCRLFCARILRAMRFGSRGTNIPAPGALVQRGLFAWQQRFCIGHGRGAGNLSLRNKRINGNVGKI